MKRVPVKVKPHAYEVLIEAGLLEGAGKVLLAQLKLKASDAHFVVVSSENVWKHWGATLSKSLDDAGLRWGHILIADGERAKSLQTIESASEQLSRLGADRSTIVIAFGGGVIGDMAGFVAAIYMRGIRCVQVPTTLLAQVDASIGGKTGVNLASGKNLIGSFHQPQCVLIDPLVLSTLEQREFRAGIYEVIKSGIIADPRLFELVVEQRDRILAGDVRAITACIESSVRVKAAIVSLDEKESGLRRVLNFGHTIGHALEAETNYKHFLHGEAVAWGMIAAALIGVAQKKTTPDAAKRITSSVLSYSPLPQVDVNPNAILRRILADKKTIKGKVHFVLAPSIGKAVVVPDVPAEVVTRAVEQVIKLSQ